MADSPTAGENISLRDTHARKSSGGRVSTKAGRCCRPPMTTAAFPGGTMDRPALQRLIGDIAEGKV